MRRPLLTAALLFIATLAPGTAHAAGNVLLPPTSNNGTASLPNLGLSAPEPTQSEPTTATAPTASPTNTTILLQTPPASSFKESDVISPINAETAAKLPIGTLPTRIIHQPDMSGMLAQAGHNLPYSLTIAIGGKSIFGAKDVQEITAKLGLTRNQIASSCFMGLRGLLQTDRSGYIFDSGLTPQASVRYTGLIKNYQMTTEALCLADPNKLPPGSGYLTEINDRFLVPLQPVTCDPPNRQVTTLTITYDGSGASQCTYN